MPHRVPKCRPLPRALMALLATAAIVTFVAPAEAADEAGSGAGVFGAPFLRVPVGARLMSSPDVVAGMQPDASLTFSNPAFTASVPRTELFVSTTSWLDDLRFSALSATFPIGSGATVLSVGSKLLYSGGLQGFDETLNVVSEESYYDLGLTAGLSRRFGGLSLGGGVTYVRQHIFPSDGNGYAFSAGASWWLGRNFLHAAANDVGGTVSFDAISYSIAGRYTVGYGRAISTGMGEIYAGAQMLYSKAAEQRLQVGVDYHLNHMFSIRASVPDALGNSAAGPAFTGGLGFRYATMGLEYAYTPQEYFSSSHTFSLTFGIGGGQSGGLAAAEEDSPVADTAPVISESQIRKAEPEVTTPVTPAVIVAPTASSATQGTSWLIVAGTHAWLNSAKSEARALELLNILTEIEPIEGGRYRVILGRYDDPAHAEEALRRYAAQGHRFSIVVVEPTP